MAPAVIIRKESQITRQQLRCGDAVGIRVLSVAANKTISHFLTNAVAGHEYFWGIGLSQIISNVPASIVLYPFTDNLAALLYGVDTAGLCSVIGSLASVINYRLYVRSYPGQGGRFMKVFTLISWAFFLIVVIPGYFLSKYWLI